MEDCQVKSSITKAALTSQIINIQHSLGLKHEQSMITPYPIKR